ncbi:hypothetical protein D3C85_1675410 [compost metagenome]
MYPHYDVTVSIQRRALALGARIGDKRTIVACAKRLRSELSQNFQPDGAVVSPQHAIGCGGRTSSDVSAQRSLFDD